MWGQRSVWAARAICGPSFSSMEAAARKSASSSRSSSGLIVIDPMRWRWKRCANSFMSGLFGSVATLSMTTWLRAMPTETEWCPAMAASRRFMTRSTAALSWGWPAG